MAVCTRSVTSTSRRSDGSRPESPLTALRPVASRWLDTFVPLVTPNATSICRATLVLPSHPSLPPHPTCQAVRVTPTSARSRTLPPWPPAGSPRSPLSLTGLALCPCGRGQRDPLKPNSGRVTLPLRIPHGSCLRVKSKVRAASEGPTESPAPSPSLWAQGRPRSPPSGLRPRAPPRRPAPRSSGPWRTPFPPAPSLQALTRQRPLAGSSSGSHLPSWPSLPTCPDAPSPASLSPVPPWNLFITCVISLPAQGQGCPISSRLRPQKVERAWCGAEAQQALAGGRNPCLAGSWGQWPPPP